jgi:hypothetical protein
MAITEMARPQADPGKVLDNYVSIKMKTDGSSTTTERQFKFDNKEIKNEFREKILEQHDRITGARKDLHVPE